MGNGPQLSLDHEVAQQEGYIVSDMAGEKVMLSVRNGKYYNLGEIGGAIWDHLGSPVRIDELVRRLLAEYRVERTECEAQVVAFLTRLHEEGLIRLTATERTA